MVFASTILKEKLFFSVPFLIVKTFFKIQKKITQCYIITVYSCTNLVLKLIKFFSILSTENRSSRLHSIAPHKPFHSLLQGTVSTASFLFGHSIVNKDEFKIWANVNSIPDEAWTTPSPVLWMFAYFHWKCLTSYIPGSLLAFHSHIMLATQSFHDQVIPPDL